MMAGRLDREIKLIPRTRAKDSSSGEILETFNSGTAIPVFADVRPVKGNERWVSQQFLADADTVFMIRWRGDITPLWQIQFDGRNYDVLACLEIGRREGLAITANTRAE